MVQYQDEIKNNLKIKLLKTLSCFKTTMIIKYFELKKNLKKNINFYLLYGSNSGLIEETLNNVLKPNFSKNLYYYDEKEILSNEGEFIENILNKSFEQDKLIIINRISDKILNLIEDILNRKLNLKIILISENLEKIKIKKLF